MTKAWSACSEGLAAQTRRARGCLGAVDRLCDRLRAALGPVLGHAARARQQLRRARDARASRRCCTSSTRWSLDGRDVRATGQLRAAAHHPARRRDGRSTEKRPYVIIDPRAGHGPGIGGFKEDSQVGVALRAGHPVYFVIFFRDPGAGTDAARRVRRREASSCSKVRALHPDEPQAGDHRQLPGRLGRDDARRLRPGRHRPDRASTARRCPTGAAPGGRRRRQPDALRRRPARRLLAVVVRRRPRQRHVRRRLPGARTSRTSIRPTPSGTSTTTCSTTSTPSRRASSSSSAGGAATS